MKILKKPEVELIIRPSIDWDKYNKFLKNNYSIEGLVLDVDTQLNCKDGDLIPMAAGKGCYKAWAVGRKNAAEYLKHIIESGHGSVLEHANFGFSIITTRAITHEIVRHRSGFAYSQESQRFCDEKDNAFIMPLSVQGNKDSETMWIHSMEESMSGYTTLTEFLLNRYQNDPLFEDLSKTDLRKKIREASRGVLPNDTATFLTMTGNVRSWRHFIEMRSSRHAEAGIRLVADEIFNSLLKECPILFGDYKKIELPDGTFECETDFKKV